VTRRAKGTRRARRVRLRTRGPLTELWVRHALASRSERLHARALKLRGRTTRETVAGTASRTSVVLLSLSGDSYRTEDWSRPCEGGDCADPLDDLPARYLFRLGLVRVHGHSPSGCYGKPSSRARRGASVIRSNWRTQKHLQGTSQRTDAAAPSEDPMCYTISVSSRSVARAGFEPRPLGYEFCISRSPQVYPLLTGHMRSSEIT